MHARVRDHNIAYPGRDYDNKCHEKREHACVWWTGHAGSFQFEKERGYCKLRGRAACVPSQATFDDFN